MKAYCLFVSPVYAEDGEPSFAFVAAGSLAQAIAYVESANGGTVASITGRRIQKCDDLAVEHEIPGVLNPYECVTRLGWQLYNGGLAIVQEVDE